MDVRITKKSFVAALGVILGTANTEVVETMLLDEETVLVTFKGGHTKKVNIACDSRAQIIIDVTKAVM